MELSVFEKLKLESGEASLKALQRVMAFEIPVQKNSHYVSRIFDALHLISDGNIMRDCMSGKGGAELCGSVFCERCRRRRQDSIYETFAAYKNAEFGDDEESARRRLRFVTVLHSVVPVDDYKTIDAAYGAIDEVVDAVSEMKSLLALLKKKAQRKFDSELWLRGGVHIELVDYDLFTMAEAMGIGTVKTETINQFIDAYTSGGSRGARWGKCFVVHFHALADIKNLSDREFRGLFDERWGLVRRQVHIQRTWRKIRSSRGETEQSLDDGLLAMARYCFNRSNAHLSFAQNWGAGKFVMSNGEEVDPRGHVVGFAEEVCERTGDQALSLGDVALLIEAHNRVGGVGHKGLLVSICNGSQSS